MGQLKVEVLNGEATVGDRIAWFSKRYGKRVGVIQKISEEVKYGGTSALRLSVLPDRKNGWYTYRQSMGPEKVAVIVPPLAAPENQPGRDAILQH
jgi:hypothetical protein